MAEVRRCRRCKRKRMDDEPPEVRQYKTCAKCRIIERQKKKLRKPLAEETMIYGMKQFQQQNTNLNFTHDDIFMDDELFNKKKYDNNNMNLNSSLYQYQYQYSYQNGEGPNGGIGLNGVAGAGTIPGDGAYAGNFDGSRLTGNATSMSIPQTMPLTTSNYHLQNLNYQQIAQRALPVQSTQLPRNNDSNPVFCDVCNEKLDVNEDITTNYKLCLNCYSNPFKLYNAFDDYNEFLKAISENEKKNIKNHIFLKEIDKNFIDNLNSMNKVINNETQFREFVLDNLKKIYIEPIIATCGYEFTLVSSNVNELSASAPSVNDFNQYQYTNTKPIRSYFKCVQEVNNIINCESNLFLDYNVISNFLKIKYNHRVHNFFLTYPLRFINILFEIYNNLEEDDKQFDANAGKLVFQELVKNVELYEEEFRNIINSIDENDFSTEFHHLQDVFAYHKDKLLNKELSEPPKLDEQGDEEEEEEKEQSDKEESNDEKEHRTEVESSGQILDPAFEG